MKFFTRREKQKDRNVDGGECETQKIICKCLSVNNGQTFIENNDIRRYNITSYSICSQLQSSLCRLDYECCNIYLCDISWMFLDDVIKAVRKYEGFDIENFGELMTVKFVME